MLDTNQMLRLLETHGRITCAQLAAMLGCEESEVADAVGTLEKNKTIIGYTTIVDWDKTDREVVSALIEVKVVPQRGEGFDRVASRIYQYKEVDSVYLMSGGFDLMVLIEGKTLKEVALFVAQKLAVMEAVSATATSSPTSRMKTNAPCWSDGGIAYADLR